MGSIEHSNGTVSKIAALSQRFDNEDLPDFEIYESLYDLSVAVRDGLDEEASAAIDGSSDEEIYDGKAISENKNVLAKLANLLHQFVSTAEEYATKGPEQKEAAEAFSTLSGSTLRELRAIMEEMEMGGVFDRTFSNFTSKTNYETFVSEAYNTRRLIEISREQQKKRPARARQNTIGFEEEAAPRDRAEHESEFGVNKRATEPPERPSAIPYESESGYPPTLPPASLSDVPPSSRDNEEGGGDSQNGSTTGRTQLGIGVQAQVAFAEQAAGISVDIPRQSSVPNLDGSSSLSDVHSEEPSSEKPKASEPGDTEPASGPLPVLETDDDGPNTETDSLDTVAKPEPEDQQEAHLSLEDDPDKMDGEGEEEIDEDQSGPQLRPIAPVETITAANDTEEEEVVSEEDHSSHETDTSEEGPISSQPPISSEPPISSDSSIDDEETTGIYDQLDLPQELPPSAMSLLADREAADDGQAAPQEEPADNEAATTTEEPENQSEPSITPRPFSRAWAQTEEGKRSDPSVFRPPVPEVEEAPQPFSRRWAQTEEGQRSAPQKAVSTEGSSSAQSTALSSIERKVPALGPHDSVVIQTDASAKEKTSTDEANVRPTASERPRYPRSNTSNDEVTDISRRPPAPESLQRKPRSKFWRWAAPVLGLLGLAGVVTGGVSRSRLSSSGGANGAPTTSLLSGNSAESGTSAPPAASSGESPKASAPDSTPIDEAEAKEHKQGIYRVNASHREFREYICGPIRSASGIVKTLEGATSSTKVSFNENPSELSEARAKGRVVLSGSESPAEIRIVIAQDILSRAVQASGTHATMRNYFRLMNGDVAEYVSTGNWSVGGKSRTAKFFNSLHASRLETSAQIIGYAPNSNPASNAGLKKLIKFAPTFGPFVQKVFRQMEAGVGSAPYDDFSTMKETAGKHIQAEINRLKKTPKSKHRDTVLSGYKYMHGQLFRDMCVNNASNLFDQAITGQIKEVTGQREAAPGQPTPAKPTQAPVDTAPKTPNKVAPPPAPGTAPTGFYQQQFHNNIAPGAPASPGISVPPSLHVTPPRHCYSKPEQPRTTSLLQRATSKVKSIFGWGSSKPENTAEFASTIAQQRNHLQSQPTKKDLPMYSWRQTIKNYLWG